MELKGDESIEVIEYKIDPNNIEDYNNWLRSKRFANDMLEWEKDYEKNNGQKVKYYRRLLNSILIGNNILLHYFAYGVNEIKFMGYKD